LKTAGLQLNESIPNIGNKFENKSFVLTGTLENYARDEIKNMIQNQGGRIASSVSAKTDYVIAGNKPGSKLKKAEELGIEILLEDGFIQLLKD